jgi:hypothetical protein
MRSFNSSCSLEDVKASRWILVAGFATGVAAFFYYYLHQLTLAHYDAKAHMVVARRIVDSLEPGYAQMGAHWLPLTHLLYLPFVVFDSQYRSGFIPSLLSVCAFAVSGWLVYRISFRITGSTAAGVFAAVLLLANPNLQYLQSCPLTEPLFMMLFLLAVDRLILWRESDRSTLPWLAAVWVSLGGLCRYEGWFLLAGVLLLLLYDAWTRTMPLRTMIRAGAVFLAVFAVPASAHFGYIFYRLGASFFSKVAAGNPDPYVTHKRPFLSIAYHLGELSQMAAILPLLLAAAGFLLVLFQRREFRARAPLLLLWIPSLINISALYWGLIYRLRYSVLLLPAVAVFGSLVLASIRTKRRALLSLAMVVSMLPWLSWYFPRISDGNRLVPGPGALLLPALGVALVLIAETRQWYGRALLVLCIFGMQLPPLALEHRPIMAETLEHKFIESERMEILQYLRQSYDGGRILIDMGKLAPLVYDSGIAVKEFVYNKGGEALWHRAVKSPEQHVGWICTQKQDAVWAHLTVDPDWARAYALVLETRHFCLYRLKH